MNNSFFAVEKVPLSIEEPQDISPQLREREGELVIIIEALRKVQKSKEWSTLKTKVFDELPKFLERELQSEARKPAPDALKLNRLAGQMKWAEKFSDLSKLEEIFKAELTQIKSKLHGKT